MGPEKPPPSRGGTLPRCATHPPCSVTATCQRQQLLEPITFQPLEFGFEQIARSFWSPACSLAADRHSAFA